MKQKYASMKTIYQLLLCIIITSTSIYSQTTLYFQGFESSCNDTWNFTGGVTNNQTFRTGSNSCRVGRSSESNTITFNTLTVTGYTGLQLQIYHSVRSGTGPGMDTREGAAIQVRLNGGAWTTIGAIGGFGDHSYAWNASPGGAGTSSAGCNIYQCANPLNYSVPVGTTTIAVRMCSIVAGSCPTFNTNMTNGTAGNFDRTDEGFFIDDITLSTTTTISSVDWNGSISTNWFCANNWTPPIVPTPTITANFSTDIAFSQRDIVLTASTIAECNNLNITGGSANDYNIKGEGNPTKVLRVYGNLTLNGQDGLDFSDGSTGTLDGTIELKGNWDNQIGEAEFKQGESTVIFNGSGNQSITITGAGPEIFYNFTVNKPGGSVTQNDNIEVCGNSGDPLADRAGILTLTIGNILTNAFYLYVSNPVLAAISGGSTASFVDGNLRRESNTVNLYDYPCGEGTRFMRAGLRTTSTSLTIMEVDAQNTGYGIYTPLEATIFDISHTRWWDISKITGSSNVNVRLYWLGTPASEGITNVSDLVVAHYSNRNHANVVSTLQWWNRGRSVANSSGLVSDGYVEGSETELTFSPHTFGTLTNANPLPVELIAYNATCESGLIYLTWSTSSEINNDHFEIEGSTDAITYENVSSIAGAGNSNSIHNYNLTLNNIHRNKYFRLVQYDYNGVSKHYLPLYLNCDAALDQLTVFINGNNLQFTIPENFSSKCMIQVMDMNGRVLKYEPLQNNGLIQLGENLSAGIYLVTITDMMNGNFMSAKFFKN